MITNYNCFNCAVPCDDYEYIENTKVWVCNNPDCRKELQHQGMLYIHSLNSERGTVRGGLPDL